MASPPALSGSLAPDDRRSMPDPSRSRVARELLAAEFGAFPGVESWVMDRLASALEPEEVRAGEAFYRAGEPAEFLYWMRDGRVEIRVPTHSSTLSGPTAFGVLDVLLERPRQGTAVALTDVSAMRVRGETWFELLDDSFELASVALTAMARDLAELDVRFGPGDPAAPPAAPEARRRGRPLNVLERIEALLDEPLLRGAGVQTISDLSMLAEESTHDSGSPVFERGAARERMYVVVEGVIVARHADPIVTRYAAAGQLVCGAAAFGQPALKWEAHALTPARLLSFRIEDWFDLMEEHSDMLRATLAALASQREKASEASLPLRRAF